VSFASPSFLWYFMPAVLALYWVIPARLRNALIATSSLVFYAWGGGRFILLLLACIGYNYAAGRTLDSDWSRARPKVRRAILVGTIVLELGVLAWWKYAAFGSAQMHHLFAAVPVMRIALPIGISFFTFHDLSYIIDVYRGNRPAQRSLVRFTMYIAMFPQLIAGPIVRYHEISEQLAQTARTRLDDFVDGFPRFALGLSKKVIVADSLAPIPNAVFAAPVASLDWRTAWIGAIAYTLQIYFDFSGYSDMAIGLARMFGLRFPENFDRPYAAVSITDFWRRWHMSLSRWFRDYVYFPLGGSRRSAAVTYRNLVIVFVLTGVWHGANWTFLVWGLFHGGLLIAERLTGLAKLDPDRFVVPRRVMTLLLVIVGWVLFRAEDLPQAVHILGRMMVPDLAATSPVLTDAGVSRQSLLVLVTALGAVLLPRRAVLGRYLQDGIGRTAWVARYAVSLAGAGYASILVAAGTFSPFLYYQF
jgi:alginate O-acetyltransferase complex protein AlgI